MRKTWRVAFMILLLLGPGVLGPGSPQAETIGKIVAIVNDEVITQEDLEAFLIDFSGKKELQGSARREKALDRLIEDKLILQKAKEIGVTVFPEEIEEVIRRVRNRFPSQEAFEEALLDAGLSYKAFEKRHKDQLIIRKMVAREVRAKSHITPREVEAYYKSHPDEFQGPESLKLSHILIRKRTAEKEVPEARALTEQLLERLRSGEDFGELARNYSEGPRKEEGGNLGFVERGKLMKEIEEALEALSPGEISDVIETPVGYHLFRLEDRKETTAKKFKEVKKEIHGRLLGEKIKKRYEAWIAELKKDAYIKQ